jgi:hypothetical protein
MSTLTREDWLAASIGAQDFQRYGCRQPSVPRETLGFSGRLVTWVFGEGDAPRPLAHPRLEALRRFACATRAGHRPGVALVSELHRLGVQPKHLAAIEGFLMV